MSNRNVNLSKENIEKTINLLLLNLTSIINSETLKTDLVNFNALNFNFFEDEKLKDKNVFLAFGGKKKYKSVCKIERLWNKLINNKSIMIFLQNKLVQFQIKNILHSTFLGHIKKGEFHLDTVFEL